MLLNNMNIRTLNGLAGATIVALILLRGAYSFHGTPIDYQVSLSPSTLMVWPLILIILLISWRLPAPTKSNEKSSWLRLFCSLSIDYGLIFSFYGMPICFFSLVIESTYTGVFLWQFERAFPRNSDIAIYVLFLISFALTWTSFGMAIYFGKQTPGGSLTKTIIKLDKSSSFGRCASYGIFAYVFLATPKFISFIWDSGGKLKASAYNCCNDKA